MTSMKLVGKAQRGRLLNLIRQVEIAFGQFPLGASLQPAHGMYD